MDGEIELLRCSGATIEDKTATLAARGAAILAQALENKDVPLVRELQARTEAVACYLKRINASAEARIHATELNVDSHRTLGKILSKMQEDGELLTAKQAFGPTTSRARRQHTSETNQANIGYCQEPPKRLVDIGMTWSSTEYQYAKRLMRVVDDAEYESIKETVKERDGFLSCGTVYKEIMSREHAEKATERNVAQAPIEPDPRVHLTLGRFQDVDPGAESIDLVLTDPPYGEDWVEAYRDLSGWANHVLKPGGSLLCMIGHVALPTMLRALESSLTYVWTLCYAMDAGGGSARCHPLNIIIGWKPIIWLCKGDKPSLVGYNPDTYIDKTYGQNNGRTKDDHEWQQNQSYFDWLVEKYTLNTHIVCDPFLGSGTTGVAAKRFGRQFIGIECDKEAYDKAAIRISNAPGPQILGSPATD